MSKFSVQLQGGYHLEKYIIPNATIVLILTGTWQIHLFVTVYASEYMNRRHSCFSEELVRFSTLKT